MAISSVRNPHIFALVWVNVHELVVAPRGYVIQVSL